VDHGEEVLAREPAPDRARVGAGDGRVVAGDEERADRRPVEGEERLAEPRVVDGPGRLRAAGLAAESPMEPGVMRSAPPPRFA
jgi:hypothetical protein